MTSSRQTMDEVGRKRHLEELFADEPFLSPTMKARRMHEKLQELNAREFASDPSSALMPEDLFDAMAREEPTRPVTTAGGRSVMTLDQAKAHLSGHGVPDQYGFDPSDPLSYFRTQVLSQWFQKVDRREADAIQEEPDGRPTELAARPFGSRATLGQSQR